MAAVRRVFATDHLRLVGLHSHIGSQIFEVDGFELAAHRVIGLLREIVAEFGPEKTAQLSTVDLGGGLGISYLARRRSAPGGRAGRQVDAIVSDESAAVGLPAPRLVVEPGRAIAGPGTITLYEVGTVKDVDVSATGAPTLRQRRRRHERQHPHRAVRRAIRRPTGLADQRRDRPRRRRVVGKHCESGDIVVRDTWVPDDVRPATCSG